MARQDFLLLSGFPGQSEDRFHQGWFEVIKQHWARRGNSYSELEVVLPFQPATGNLHVARRMGQIIDAATLHITEDGRVISQIHFQHLSILDSQSLGMVDGRLAEAFHFQFGERPAEPGNIHRRRGQDHHSSWR